MGLFDIDFSLQVKRLLPPKFRLTRWLAWLTTVMYPVQRSRDEFFTNYADNNLAAAWSGVTAYVFQDQVLYTDRSIYECINVNGVTSTTPPPQDPDNWLKVQEIWIGVRERKKYSSQKLLLEYILNNWFGTVFRQPVAYAAASIYYTPKSDIYIDNTPLTNNIFKVGIDEDASSSVSYNESGAVDYIGISYSFSSSCFTINIPLLVYNLLGPDAASRDGAIRAIVDKYVIAGITYKITTY